MIMFRLRGISPFFFNCLLISTDIDDEVYVNCPARNI